MLFTLNTATETELDEWKPAKKRYRIRWDTESECWLVEERDSGIWSDFDAADTQEQAIAIAHKDAQAGLKELRKYATKLGKKLARIEAHLSGILASRVYSLGGVRLKDRCKTRWAPPEQDKQSYGKTAQRLDHGRLGCFPNSYRNRGFNHGN